MRLVNTSGAVSVQDLVSFLNISESTVRRDLLTLDREGVCAASMAGPRRCAMILRMKRIWKTCRINIPSI